MRKFCVVFLAGCVLSGATGLLAQDDSTRYLFAEYYVCDQNREGFSDLLTEHVFGPIYDRHVEAGQQAAYSTDYVCDVTRQERADEIVKELYAPALNQMVETGQLAAWSWYAHVVGG